MIIFVCRFRKIHAGHGPWKILILMFSSEFPCLPQRLGNDLYPFSSFSNIVNEFHRQLWNS